jgi:hypothetical protein
MLANGYKVVHYQAMHASASTVSICKASAGFYANFRAGAPACTRGASRSSFSRSSIRRIIQGR